jgi:hypothetical protein
MGKWTKSEYFLDDVLGATPCRILAASSLRWRTISVPGCLRSPGATVNVPSPEERQSTGSAPGIMLRGLHVDAGGDHEGRVEADAELADELERCRLDLAASARRGSGRNSRVPERAMVPRFSITSSRVMPMPLSSMVSVRASSSRRMSMPLAVGSATSLRVSARKRALSRASEALEISSRRKTSLFA